MFFWVAWIAPLTTQVPFEMNTDSMVVSIKTPSGTNTESMGASTETRVLGTSTHQARTVLVNRKGSFFGYFTINEYRSDAVSFAASMRKIFENANGDLTVIRNRLCDALH